MENIKDLVKEMPEIPKKEIKRRELAYKASAKEQNSDLLFF